MRLTPLDIRKQPFRRAYMGFDRDEVNSFLEMVAAEYEQIIRQNDELSARTKHLQEQVEEYSKIEKVLNETLLTAQKASDDARLNAHKEAELIIKDAQIRSDRYVDQAENKVHQLESELINLRTQRNSFLTRFRSMLRDQMALVDILREQTEEKMPEQKVGGKSQ